MYVLLRICHYPVRSSQTALSRDLQVILILEYGNDQGKREDRLLFYQLTQSQKWLGYHRLQARLQLNLLATHRHWVFTKRGFLTRGPARATTLCLNRFHLLGTNYQTRWHLGNQGAKLACLCLQNLGSECEYQRYLLGACTCKLMYFYLWDWRTRYVSTSFLTHKYFAFSQTRYHR